MSHITHTQLSLIETCTDLDVTVDTNIKLELIKRHTTYSSLETIEADKALYNYYQTLFIKEVSQFIKSSIGERDELDRITKLIEKMGFAGFHSIYNFDFQSMLDSYGAQNENDIYFGGDEIYTKYIGLYNEYSDKLRFMSEDENLYDDYIMNL